MIKMTEEEKIFAGQIFDPRKKELKDIKHRAHEACRRAGRNLSQILFVRKFFMPFCAHAVVVDFFFCI